MTTLRLSTDQQRRLIEDFQSDDQERRESALSVFLEHDLTIHDIAEMSLLVVA